MGGLSYDGPNETRRAALARTQDEAIAILHATYTWQGKTKASPETRVAFHTRVDLFDEISAIVTAAQPYEVSCVIALPIISASPSQADWIITTRTSLR